MAAMFSTDLICGPSAEVIGGQARQDLFDAVKRVWQVAEKNGLVANGEHGIKVGVKSGVISIQAKVLQYEPRAARGFGARVPEAAASGLPAAASGPGFGAASSGGLG